MEMKNMQIGIKITPECDSTEDIRSLIFGIMNIANDKGFAIDCVHIDGIESFRSDKEFINI